MLGNGYKCPDSSEQDLVLKTHDKLRWCRARNLFGSQIPVTIGEFELRISYI